MPDSSMETESNIHVEGELSVKLSRASTSNKLCISISPLHKYGGFNMWCEESELLRIADTIVSYLHAINHPGPNGETPEEMHEAGTTLPGSLMKLG